MIDAIERSCWPSARLGEAIEELARRARLGPRLAETPAADPRLAAPEPDALDRWVQAAAAWLGIEAVPVETPYGQLEGFLRRGGPAVIRLPGDGAPRFLLLLGSRRGQVALLAPDLAVRRAPFEALRAALCADLERPVIQDLDRLLELAQVPPGRRPASRRRMLLEHIRSRRIGGCWILRAPPGAGFLRQIAGAGALRHLAMLASAIGAGYGLTLLAWWILGQGALAAAIEPGWLVAWGVLTLALVPFQLLATWSASMLGIKVGGALKQRLLAGVLKLAPEEIRHQGAGQLLGLVVQSEAVEAFGLRSGVLTLVGLLELAATLAVIGQGAGGGLHVLLLLGWMALTGLFAVRYVGDYRRRIDVRLSLTHDLVERMVGHRTRLAQEPRERWHEGEDQLVERHFERLKATDRAGVMFSVVVPRGWLVLGVLGLGPAFIGGATAPAALAVGLGAVLLAYDAFRRVAFGIVQLIEVWITWGRIAPLFQAARRGEPPCAPGFALDRQEEPAPRPERPAVVEAHDLVFRYHDRARPVLQGMSLRIDAGDRILVEGPSGSGKSTLGALLAGLRVPEAGLLLCAGLDRRTLGSEGWRRRVVAAPQFHENHVLMGTFAFNLLMGQRWPARQEDVDEAEAICRELALGPLLDRMPSGMHQVVGETGWQLSHGERSRLFIARALLHGADLVVLDESFAALDPATLGTTLECVLRRARSLVVIAHP